MDEERIKTLQARRIDYETNPMWVKKEYVPFPYPEVLEKAGYRVENIDDYTKLEVYDAITGEKLYLDDVKHDRIVFANSGGKYFSVCKFGRIELMLPTYEDLEIVFYKDNKTISYEIPHEMYLAFLYNSYFREDIERIIGVAQLRVRNEEFKVRQTSSRFHILDTSLYILNKEFPEKYSFAREEMDKDTFLSIFTPIIGLAKVGKIKCNLSPWAFEFFIYCIEHHAQDFINVRYTEDCIKELIASYERQKQLIERDANEKIAKISSSLELIVPYEEQKQSIERDTKEKIAQLDELIAAEKNNLRKDGNSK